MPEPVERELLAHATTLRALARDLVGEQHADDLVQDAAVEALRAPPRRPGPLGGWLATVVRHLASKHRRAERRRRAREALAARPERIEPEPAGEEREAFLRLTRAVLAMPEPYQSTLLQRYLRSLTPTEIAARSGVPLRTVKTRLQRGLAILRSELDRDGTDWRAAFGPAFGLHRLLPAAAAGVTTGVLLMGTGTKLTLSAAAAVAAITALFWLGAGAPPRANVASNASSSDVAAATGDAPRSPGDPVVATDAARRTAIDAPPDPFAAAATATIRGRCVDEHGAALAGVEAKARCEDAADPQGRAPVAATSAADGTFAVPVPIAIAGRVAVWFTLAAPARSALQHRFRDLAPAQVVDVGDVVLAPETSVRGRVVDRRGQPQADVEVRLWLDWSDDLRRRQLQPTIPAPGRTRSDGTFGPVAMPGLQAGRARTDRRLVEGRDVGFRLDEGPVAIELVVCTDDDLPPIRGVVVDETGVAVAGARVQLGSHDVTTATDGGFASRPGWDTMGEGPFELRVSAPGFADATSGPHALGTEDVRVVLRREPELLVRVRDAATGRPVTKFSVALTWSQLGGMHVGPLEHQQPCAPRPDGVARIAGVRNGDWLVHVDPGDGPWAASAFVPVTVTDGATVHDVLVEMTGHADRLLRVVDNGSPVAGAEVELLDTSGLPLSCSIEAFSIEDWNTLMGTHKVLLLQRGTTDERGELLLSGPTGRDLALRLRGEGIALQTVARVRLDSDAPLEVRAAPGATWTGALVPRDVAAELFARSQPSPGRNAPRRTLGIELWREGPHGREFPERLVRHLDPLPAFDADGRFRVEGIPAGTWQVTLHACGKRLHCEQITVDAGETLVRDLDVETLRLTELELQVFVDGEPLREGRVNLRGSHGTQRDGRPFATSHLLKLDREGRLRQHVFGGEFSCHVYVDDSVLWFTPPFHVPAGGEHRQTLHVQRATLALRLHTPAGSPAAGVPLRLDLPGNHLPPTDAEGRTTHAPVAAGRYRLQAMPRSLGTQQAQAAHANVHGWDAVHAAWLDVATIDVPPGTASPEIGIRLPPEWDR